MKFNRNACEFIIVVLKCFFILTLFGVFLPRCFDCLLYNLICKQHIYDNSILVHNLVHKNLDIINNYIIVFRKFLDINTVF